MIMNKIKTSYKYLASFLKNDWEIDDYPITFKYTDMSKVNTDDRFKPIEWIARLDN